MLKLIAHRGNIDGPNSKLENKLDYIDNAIDLGYEALVDIWSYNGKMYLGNHTGSNRVPIDCLMNRSTKLWIHCGNHEAFQILFRYQSLNIFWHQTDDFALTTKGYTWCYPGIGPLDRSVAFMPEFDSPNLDKFHALCSDEVSLFKGML